MTLHKLNIDDAIKFFENLPVFCKISTLSPRYVQADASRSSLLKPVFYLYKEGKRYWYHSLHEACVINTNLKYHNSAYGYAGPVSNSRNDNFLRTAWKEYVQFNRANRVIAEFLRIHPCLDVSATYLGHKEFNRKTIFVDLRVPDLLSSYSTRCRTAIRKAQKNLVQVDITDNQADINKFSQFYRDAMIEMGADSFYFFSDFYFKKIFDLNNANLLVCKQDGNWVSAGIFLVGGSVMEYHLSASTAVGKKIGAPNLLLHSAAILGKSLKLEKLFLGGGTDSDTNNSLLFFKKSFSKKELDFSLGKVIFMETEYNELKNQYINENKSVSKHLFFENLYFGR